MVEDEEIVEVRETHRRPNIQPFLDDLDCWLVASIEDDDLETNSAKAGPIGDRAGGGPEITSAAAALAVVLNERGCIDIDHIAELLHGTATTSSLNSPAPFRDPANGSWQTADSYRQDVSCLLQRVFFKRRRARLQFPLVTVRRS